MPSSEIKKATPYGETVVRVINADNEDRSRFGVAINFCPRRGEGEGGRHHQQDRKKKCKGPKPAADMSDEKVHALNNCKRSAEMRKRGAEIHKSSAWTKLARNNGSV